MQKSLSWEAYSNDGRNRTIEIIRNTISYNDGCIINFNMFSDLAMTLSIEIEEIKIPQLHKALSFVIKLTELEEINFVSTKEWTIFINLSFSNGTGYLKQEIPEVPG